MYLQIFLISINRFYLNHMKKNQFPLFQPLNQFLYEYKQLLIFIQILNHLQNMLINNELYI